MAGLKIHVMKTVSEGTKEIIIRRARMDGLRELFQTHAALGGGRENTKRTGRLKKPPGADDKEG